MLKLSGKNLELFAAQNYKNHRCIDYDEFKDDLARFKYVKRLVKRYINKREIDIRLLLNHIILIYNVFDIGAANTIFEYKYDTEELTVIVPFLSYLNYLAQSDFRDVKPDLEIIKRLNLL